MKVILSSQEGSLPFKDRILLLDSRTGQVGVLRATPQNQPSDNNVTFDCKVITVQSPVPTQAPSALCYQIFLSDQLLKYFRFYPDLTQHSSAAKVNFTSKTTAQEMEVLSTTTS